MMKQNEVVMTDVHTREVRSYNMSQVRNKDTKPELLVRKYLFGEGLRYRLHDKKLPGKPDIVLPKYKTVVFVHGCFWHGHENCRYATTPKTRTEFWTKKIKGNRKRDEENEKQLEEREWNVLKVYGCELKKNKKDRTLKMLLDDIRNQF